MKNSIYYLILILGISSCKSVETVQTYPKSRDEIRAEELGSVISSDQDGFKLFSNNSTNSTTHNLNKTNSTAWEAALNVVKFMPLISTDSVGGVILTDWYQHNNNSKERYKLKIFIRGGQLNANSVEVTAHKQIKRGTEWIDTNASNDLAVEIENKILTQAKTLKIEEYKNIH